MASYAFLCHILFSCLRGLVPQGHADMRLCCSQAKRKPFSPPPALTPQYISIYHMLLLLPGGDFTSASPRVCQWQKLMLLEEKDLKIIWLNPLLRAGGPVEGHSSCTSKHRRAFSTLNI